MFKYGEATAKIFRKHPGILKTRWYALLSLVAMIIAIILIILSFSSRLASTLLVAGALLYIIILLFTTFQVAARSRKPLALLTPFLLCSQHVMYNLGFLKGIITQR